MAINPSIIGFVISLIVSAIIIFIATRILGEKEGVGTALLTAFIGALIFAVAHYFIGSALLASVIGGLAWLIALGMLYKMGWLKALVVAIVIWIFAAIVSLVLPTISGPL
jgi:hypothetical protein